MSLLAENETRFPYSMRLQYIKVLIATSPGLDELFNCARGRMKRRQNRTSELMGTA